MQHGDMVYFGGKGHLVRGECIDPRIMLESFILWGRSFGNNLVEEGSNKPVFGWYSLVQQLCPRMV